MRTLYSRLNGFLTYVLSYAPADLPQTGAELEAWTSDVLRLANVRDDDTYRQFIAQAVLHLDARKRRMSKQDMVGALKRSIASQTAYLTIQDLKAKAEQKSAVPSVEAADASSSSGPA